MLFHFLLDPDPGKSSGSMRIQIHNTDWKREIARLNWIILEDRLTKGSEIQARVPSPKSQPQEVSCEPGKEKGGRSHTQLAVDVELEPGGGHLGQAGTQVRRQVGGQGPAVGHNKYGKLH